MTRRTMNWWQRFWRQKEMDEQLGKELGFHLEQHANELIAQGYTPDEARRQARLALGGQTQVEEECREARGIRWLEDFLQDLRYGFRTLWHNPGFAAIALLTMALGIGANTAIFSVISATLLRPLPFRDSNRLVFLSTTTPGGCTECWHGKIGFSDPNFLDLQEQNRVFEHMAAFGGAGFTLTGVESPQYIKGGSATAGFFPTLGIQPVLGRTFVAADEQQGQDHVVLLSDSLWKQRFGSDAKVVGTTIHLDTVPYTVVGVLPPGSDLVMPGHYGPRDLWVPKVLSHAAPRGSNHLQVIARVKPGVTLRQAEEDASIIMARLASQYPDAAGFGAKLVPVQQELTGDIRPVLLVLFGAVGLVLLIACGNVANLQSTHASGRHKEIAVRTALGATPARIMRQLLTESLLLALIGGALGCLLSASGSKLLLGLRSSGLSSQTAITFDLPVLAYSLALSLLTGILFGLPPALQCAGGRWHGALKLSGRTSAGEGGGRVRNFLTVGEIALSMVLLAGAGLLLRSFVSLLQVDPGFSTKNVMVVSFALPRYSYSDSTRQAAFYSQVMEQARALPGVKAVGAIDDLPLTQNSDSDRISIADHPQFNGEKSYPTPQERLVTPDYFRAMGIPLMDGRSCSNADPSTPLAIIVNQSFAHAYFAGENPIGQRIKFGPPDAISPWINVVGVVGDVRSAALANMPAAEIYACYHQNALRYNPLAHMYLVVLTTGSDQDVTHALLERIRALDSNLPLPKMQPMDAIYAESIAARRFNMLLLGTFALIAVVLAAVGIYGVISYSVICRTQEIGVRLALGAMRLHILRMILGRGLVLTLTGVVIGVAGALAFTRVLSSMLYHVSPTDALTFTAVGLLLATVAMCATYLPARRATKIDPMVAMRSE